MGASLVAQLVKNLPAVQETQVPSLGWQDPLEKEMATHSSILAGKSHGQKSLVGCSPWGHKESGTTGQLTLTYLYSLQTKMEEALYSQQKQDQQLTVTQIMNTLLPNSDSNWRK